MEAVPLDPRDYDGTYKLVGGELSLDLVNTISWPGREREHDWLDPPGNVAGWGEATGLLDTRTRREWEHRAAEDPARLAEEAAAVRHIRDTLTKVLVPRVRRTTPAAGAVAELNRLLTWAVSQRRLDRATLRWTWRRLEGLEEMVAPVVVNAAHVLTEVDSARLRFCPACAWLFHDTSRNGRRRWCDMADCGSRDKSRRHYHRQVRPDSDARRR